MSWQDGSRRDRIEQMLFELCGTAEPSGEGVRLYALLSAAARPEVPIYLVGFAAEYRPLFQGQAQDDLEEAAPYLVAMERGTAVSDWIVSELFGRRAGIFLQSRLDIDSLRRHLRKFTKIQDAGGKFYYFKFYDPRTVRQFFPAFTPAQAASFFRSAVDAVLIEDDRNTDFMLHLAVANGALATKNHALSDAANKVGEAPTYAHEVR
jgi:hypothetical protein